jgi:gentisate 1,2-dioxygenase
MVTPPGSVHSHHTAGTRPAHWLIVQDGGFYYHCRTMGFRFENE